MWIYIARRILWLPFLLIAVSLVTFTLGRFGPGDPIQVMLGNRYDPDSEVTRNLEEQFGLDKSFVVQYTTYIWDALHGDFGESFRYRGRAVGSLIATKMWVSFQINLVAMVVSVGIGLPLGFWIAHHQGRWQDPAVISISLMLMSVPIMVSIPSVLWLLCLKLDLLPCSGWGGFWDVRMIIPAITMGIPGVAIFARLMRASTLDVMGQDFIRTAHAKGLSSLSVDYRHTFKNAMIPIVTILAFSLAGMMSTGFITERILGIPGVGNLAIDAIFNRDYPIIMAITLIGATAFVVANLIADIAYSIVDPRIRYQ
jgi:ABC-type dipeptide/oligopeptide/nickel transport system permease component